MSGSNTRGLAALLFDKDGTLIDLEKSWAGWARRVVDRLAGDDLKLKYRLDDILGYNRAGNAFHPGSIIIAGSPRDVAGAAAEVLPKDISDLETMMAEMANDVRPVPICPLRPFLSGLRGVGLRLGVATNDAEAPARAQLSGLGVVDYFDSIIGYDSGFGAKPEPGMCLAYADQLGLLPESVAMIGDSLHDMHAGRAAGMITVAVVSGGADREELEPHADHVLNSIKDIPAWLEG